MIWYFGNKIYMDLLKSYNARKKMFYKSKINNCHYNGYKIENSPFISNLSNLIVGRGKYINGLRLFVIKKKLF